MKWLRLHQSNPEASTLPMTQDKPAEEPTQTLIGQKSRPANLVSDVLVPFVQSIITGLLVGLVVKTVWHSKDWPVWAAVAMLCVWILQTVMVSRLLWAAERVFHIDLNRDGRIGPPALPPVILNNRVRRVIDPRTQQVKVAPAPIHPFERFVTGCERIGTDMRKWEAAGIPRAVYQAWRDQLIGGGWATWDSYNVEGRPNTTQGWHLTAPAADIIKHASVQ